MQQCLAFLLHCKGNLVGAETGHRDCPLVQSEDSRSVHQPCSQLPCAGSSSTWRTIALACCPQKKEASAGSRGIQFPSADLQPPHPSHRT